MKKIGNIILIIVAVIVLHTIIDLIAIYSFNRPVFAVKGDNYKYHGLFYDTYFCREYSAPFIKAKWNKYECIIPNENIITEDKTKKISKIEDLMMTRNDLMCAQALETFYSDSEYEYYFNCMKSGMIIVTYEDGTEENVKEALNNGNITIEDLDKHNIGYNRKPRVK